MSAFSGCPLIVLDSTCERSSNIPTSVFVNLTATFLRPHRPVWTDFPVCQILFRLIAQLSWNLVNSNSHRNLAFLGLHMSMSVRYVCSKLANDMTFTVQIDLSFNGSLSEKTEFEDFRITSCQNLSDFDPPVGILTVRTGKFEYCMVSVLSFQAARRQTNVSPK